MALENDLGLVIRRGRLAAGLSQEKLAEIIEVDRVTIGIWERGEARPRPSHIKALIDAGILDATRLASLLELSGNDIVYRKYVISISPPRTLLSNGCKFGILHIRNGPASKIDSTQTVNRHIRFQPTGIGDEMRATVRASHDGFEFKCFVECSSLRFEDVKNELLSNGFLEPTIGEGRAGRVWFLLKKYRIVAEPRTEIRNNFLFPNSNRSPD